MVGGLIGHRVSATALGVRVTAGISVCVGVGPRVGVGGVAGGPPKIKGIMAATITPVAPMSTTIILTSILLLLLCYSVALNMLSLALLGKGHLLKKWPYFYIFNSSETSQCYD